MLSALIELLEEKGILTQQEWENRIKQKTQQRPSKSLLLNFLAPFFCYTSSSLFVSQKDMIYEFERNIHSLVPRKAK